MYETENRDFQGVECLMLDYCMWLCFCVLQISTLSLFGSWVLFGIILIFLLHHWHSLLGF